MPFQYTANMRYFNEVEAAEIFNQTGANYVDARRRHYTVERLARRMAHRGYRVHLAPVAASVA